MCHSLRSTLVLACRLAVITLLVSLCSTALHAQVTSGTIFGTVEDPSGAPVADATVVATDPGKGVSRTVTTGTSGEFVFANVPPGEYTITVESKGFKKLEKSGIVLNVADRVNAGELVLRIGVTTESVTVTADGGQIQLQSNSGERSDLITSKQLEDVAMNGRNVLDYMKLVPGVISSFDGHASATGGLDAMNINGTRANEHEFTVDGASNVDTGNNGGTHITINPDAIDEVRILTSNYQAEFGKAAGGQIAIVTKGGTNQWHGGATFFHRNEGLNANDWFANKNGTPIAKYRYNYIGYDFGGPIVRNKLFVFWNQEFYRQLVPSGGITQFYVPTALERQGDFSQSTDGNGNPIVISGPAITNNKIDPTKLTTAQQSVFSNMEKMLSLFPKPNVSGFGVGGQNYNFSEALSATDPRREDILRIDYQISGKYRLFGRWIYNADTMSAPFTSSGIGPFGTFACDSSINFPGGCTQKHPGWNLSINLVASFTPTLLNELSVGPSHTLSLDQGVNGNISLAKNGITLPLLYPSDTIPDLTFNGLSNVNFGGGYLGATPWKQANTTINVNDNLTKILQTHTLKFGMFYQRSRKDQIAWGNINGQLTFGLGPTGGGTCPIGQSNCVLGDPLASALLGSFDGLSQSTARPTGYFRYNQLEFYLQDTWKTTRRLTLDYGMRFAWIPPQYDARNQIALFNPFTYNPASAVQIDTGGNIISGSGNPLEGMTFTANHNIPVGGWNDRGIMPEPRLGFAYDVFSDHKTVVRGGFGMTHDRPQGNLIFNPVFSNPALVQTAQVAAGNIANLTSPSYGTGVLGNIVGASRDGHVPTVYSYSLGIQRELFKGATLDVAYVGNLGRHLISAHDINAIPYGYAFTRAAQDPANFTAYCAAPQPGNPCTNGIPQVEPNLPTIYSAAGYNFSGINALGRNSYTNAPLVPYKGYGQITYLQFDGTSSYNSLQVSFQRRYNSGLTFGAVYTYSKTLTTLSSDPGGTTMVDPFLTRLVDYGAASFDRTHVFAANYVYDIPNVSKHLGGTKWVSYITDHYQLSGVTQFMTGTPIPLWNAFSFESGALDGSNMWDAIGYWYTLDKSGNPVFPVIGTRIRGSNDLFRTGGMQNWDMSLFKNIPLREKFSIQLRVETFNTFNHPNFNNKNYGFSVDGPWQWQPGTPVSITKNNNWGTYSDTYSGGGGPRVVQLGARFIF
jgi:Carboxypeptidase regulatory-like domain/TonB-dependent Receptor Plug Domain